MLSVTSRYVPLAGRGERGGFGGRIGCGVLGGEDRTEDGEGASPREEVRVRALEEGDLAGRGVHYEELTGGVRFGAVKVGE